jgi:hypothetical protein
MTLTRRAISTAIRPLTTTRTAKMKVDCHGAPVLGRRGAGIESTDGVVVAGSASTTDVVVD